MLVFWEKLPKEKFSVCEGAQIQEKSEGITLYFSLQISLRIKEKIKRNQLTKSPYYSTVDR
jgi:hypothetical protein